MNRYIVLALCFTDQELLKLQNYRRTTVSEQGCGVLFRNMLKDLQENLKDALNHMKNSSGNNSAPASLTSLHKLLIKICFGKKRHFVYLTNLVVVIFNLSIKLKHRPTNLKGSY
ncbi:hypothetical protein L1887_22506 [Cichorium endivia]|nr:hypothetical protein L1887_22506 [Cichorium endivia]